LNIKRPQKISFEDLFKTTTMFYINAEYEKKLNREIEDKITSLISNMVDIDTRDGLKRYISLEKDALDNITTVMGISSQRFMRMVSMVRKDKGYIFETEWDLKGIRNNMLQNSNMMESICDLLLDGKHNPYFKERIPTYFLENMIIDESTISRLENHNELGHLLRKGVEGRYSNNIGDLINADIVTVLDNTCRKYGLEYKKEIKVPLIGRSVNFVLEDELHPTIIMDVSFSVTTASSMSTKKKAAIDTRKIIESYNANHTKKITFINFMDGAGWIGRQSDMRAIHQVSDYVLNFNNLSDLENIIATHIEDF
jgi:hypothetical protein